MQQDKSKDPRRNLPAVGVLLNEKRIQELVDEFTRPIVMRSIGGALDHLRKKISGGDSVPGIAEIVALVESYLRESEGERLRHVINGTGIILHTGLGRAVLPGKAVDALSCMKGCCNMQINLKTGLRGMRSHMTESLVCQITGAEAAIIVNNNAAATYLIMAALCRGKDVIISRGQLIEIGGSYRLPDCVTESGANIVEVGTTNRTHLRDYENALSESTGAILRAKASNYRIIGFTKEVSIGEIVSLKQKHDVYVIDDLGSGSFVDLSRYGLPKEPSVQESIKAGADIVCFSGDKLVGGAQAGIIAGKKELISRIRKHPLNRMFRVCKLTDLVLEKTLRLFLEPETLEKENPTYMMLSVSPELLKKKAKALKKRLDRENLVLKTEVKKGESAVGGGSLPEYPLPGYTLSVRHESISSDRLALLLRQNEPPVISRICDEEVLLDMRTVLEGEADLLFEALCSIGRKTSQNK